MPIVNLKSECQTQDRRRDILTLTALSILPEKREGRSNRAAGSRAWWPVPGTQILERRESKRHTKSFLPFYLRSQFSGPDNLGARNRLSLVRREKSRRKVSLSVFSLAPDLLFDCSRVYEYAKIRTVLQSLFQRSWFFFSFTNRYPIGVSRHVLYRRFQNGGSKWGRCRRRCSKWRFSPGLCLENSRCGIYVWSCGYSGCRGGGSCTGRGNQIHRHEKRASGEHFAVITRATVYSLIDFCKNSPGQFIYGRNLGKISVQLHTFIMHVAIWCCFSQIVHTNTLNSRLLRNSQLRKSFLILREKFKANHRIRTLFSVI